MRSCRDPKRPQVCEPQVVEAEVVPCEPFSFCAGNLAVHWDGSCLSAEPRQYRIPDGTHTSITFQNGCIVGVGDIPAPMYTPSECCGAPGGGGSGGGQVDVPISADPNNLTSLRPDGVFTGFYYRAGQGVTLTGVGTVYDPFIVNALPPTPQGIAAQALPPLKATGDGSPSAGLVIGMVPGTMLPGTYGPLTIDAYGLVQGYDEEAAKTEVSVTGVVPIAVRELSTNNFQVSMTLPEPSPAGTFELGPYQLSIGIYGTVTGLQRTRPPITPGRLYTAGGTAPDGEVIPAKIAAYDADGFIVSVTNV